MNKNSRINIPPNYLYASLLISGLSWYFLPVLNIIKAPYNYLGWCFVILGIYFTVWSWQRFKVHGTPEDFSKSTKLVTDGPFKYSRNPMYLGMFLVTLGAAICLKNLLGILGAFIYFIVLNNIFIPFEEEKNMNTFGKEFAEYKRNVRKWL